MHKIAIGGISTECSTYSPLLQKKENFTIIRDKELLELVNFPFEKYNIHAYPIFFSRSLPGGPIEYNSYILIKNNFFDCIKNLLPLKGIMLLMHGAMHVSGIDDPEGEWIEELRKIVGKETIISLSYDLHGQITDKIIKNINIFSAFKTAPHIDVELTYYRSAKMLSEAIDKKITPIVLWSPIPILVSGEMSSTSVEPCQSFFKSLSNYENKTILDVSLMIGYVWADTFRATAASVVTCHDIKRGQYLCQYIALKYWNLKEKLVIPGNKGSFKNFLNYYPQTFSILADSGDNPTAGGVGDRCDVLKFLLDKKICKVLIAGIASPTAYSQLKISSSFSIGGSLGGGGPKLNLVADKIYFLKECAIVKIKSVTIIITNKRRSFHYLNDFNELNINIKKYNLLVVKSGYLSPDLHNLKIPSFMILSEGAVNQNLLDIQNNKRMKPIYPFQLIEKFEPKVNKYV